MNKLDGSAQWNYTYNADGLRTQRTDTVTDLTYNYTYLGDQLTHMTVDGHTMYFTYDASGTPMSLTYDGVTYYYVTNLQGDVVAILNGSGAKVVSYAYDAWGNPINPDTQEDTVGFYNPLRYRGYVYDEETELYYLQSRYYDPEMGRFINADGLTSTGQGVLGNNMFAYCANNPVNGCDPTGKFPFVGLTGSWLATKISNALTKINNKLKAGYDALTQTEKALAKKHPIAAYKVSKARDIADQYTQERYGSGWDHGSNEANAFRHAMWNAVMTDKIGEKKAKEFADAHEAEYLTDQLEYCIMDFHNNQLGRQIAIEYAGQGYDVFAEKIQEAIEEGQAYVITWDE